MDTSGIRCLQDAEVYSLLSTELFQTQWNTLFARCPWASGFQNPGYIQAWYSIYRDKYRAVLVLDRDDRGELRAILPLCLRPGSRQLCHAGDMQAGYQAWLAPDEAGGNDFMRQAVALVRNAFPRARLRLRYLAPGVPLDWLEHADMRHAIELQAHPRPLLKFGDGGQIRKSLAKKNNRTRMRQLRKLGDVRIENLTDPVARHALLEQLMPLYDARHLSIRGIPPFGIDPLFTRFAKTLLDVPGLLHVSALRVGEQLAFGQLSIRSPGMLHMGLSAHNPWMSHQSPGKLHLFLLSQMLMQEGYTCLDLTAGGDLYKERFANDHDTVHALTVYPSRSARVIGRVKHGLRESIKRRLVRAATTPRQLRHTAFRARGLISTEMCHSAAGWLRRSILGQQAMVLVKPGPTPEAPNSPDFPVRRDCMQDLSSCGGSRWARWRFMEECVRRCERGEHVYTVRLGNEIAHCTWVIEQPDKEEVKRLLPGAPEAFTPGAIVVHQFTAPVARRRGIARAVLARVLWETSLHGAGPALVILPPGAAAAAKLARACEFVPLVSWKGLRQFTPHSPVVEARAAAPESIAAAGELVRPK